MASFSYFFLVLFLIVQVYDTSIKYQYQCWPSTGEDLKTPHTLPCSKQQAETVKDKLNRVEHEALKELLRDECIKSEMEEKKWPHILLHISWMHKETIICWYTSHNSSVISLLQVQLVFAATKWRKHSLSISSLSALLVFLSLLSFHHPKKHFVQLPWRECPQILHHHHITVHSPVLFVPSSPGRFPSSSSCGFVRSIPCIKQERIKKKKY